MWVTDVELRYSPAHWQFALGADNVLDKYPTPEPAGPRPASLGGYYPVINYFLPFSVLSPSGFSGRYLYGRLSYRF
jgi:iron complex outermembrane receptor protein